MMTPTKRTASIHALETIAFGERLGMHVCEPRVRSSICHAWNEVLRAPEGEGGDGGGGGEKKFSQADLDKVLGERLAKEREKFKDYDALKTQVAELSKKAGEADEREAKAREEAELKGKSDLERTQIQLNKANERLKALETDHAKALKERDEKLSASAKRFTDHVTTAAVKEALMSAKVAAGSSKHAARIFMDEAQIELAEDGVTITRVTIGGKQFDKPEAAAAHFLSENKHFASVPSGGSGNDRSAGRGTPAQGDVTKTSADDDFAVGYSH